MSKINNLVPKLELCKLIPDGCFTDSMYCWHYTDLAGFVCRTTGCEQFHHKEWQIVLCHPRKIEMRRKHGEEIYPAPTLQEILEQIPADKAEIVRIGNFKWNVDCGIVWQSGDRLIDTALKVWLKMKGLADEQ